MSRLAELICPDNHIDPPALQGIPGAGKYLLNNLHVYRYA